MYVKTESWSSKNRNKVSNNLYNKVGQIWLTFFKETHEIFEIPQATPGTTVKI